VILLTEYHGELDFRLTEKKDGTDIILSCSKTLNEQEKLDWKKAVQGCFERFQKALESAS
jgi:hypothetical protein